MFRLAVPNKGALSEGAVSLLSDAGYRCRRHGRELVVRDAEHATEFIYLRPRDIAVYVGSGLIHAGITGRDLAIDSQAPHAEHLGLGIGRSRFCYAAPRGQALGPNDWEGKRIATSLPNLVRRDLEARGIGATVVRLDGAVEISVSLGVADLIADVVESGRTLEEAGLEIVGEPILKSEAILITRDAQPEPVPEGLLRLKQRIEGILVARSYVLLNYVMPEAQRDAIIRVTPGVKSPTLSPVSEPGWVAVAAMVRQKGLNAVIDELAGLGAKGILASEIKTCRL